MEAGGSAGRFLYFDLVCFRGARQTTADSTYDLTGIGGQAKPSELVPTDGCRNANEILRNVRAAHMAKDSPTLPGQRAGLLRLPMPANLKSSD
jgi:hypothetical protein